MKHLRHAWRANVMTHRLIWGVMLAMMILSAALASSQQSSSTVTDKSPDPTLPSPVTATMRAYANPETGQLGAPPDTANVPESSEAVKRFTSTSVESLQEEPAPGGGMMVDLKGRFGSLTIATQDQSGKMTISHASQSHEAVKPMETDKP